MFRRSIVQSLAALKRPAASSIAHSRVVPSLIYQATRSNIRYHSSDNHNNHNNENGKSAQLKVDQPQLMLAMTCKKCNTRSSHAISKQAYTSGTVLITCPGCQNRHLIADHLKIFSDNNITIEDILKAKGESVSSSTNDLVFDEIPEKLKGLIGHHAKDAPVKENEQPSDDPHYLPGEKKNAE